MSALLRRLSRWLPPWVRVLRTRFGAKPVAASAAGLAVFVAMVGMSLAMLPARLGGLASLAVVLVAAFLGWRLRAFDLLGKIGCARAGVDEHLSRNDSAARQFRAAAGLLRDPLPAFEGLTRLGEPRDLGRVAEIILADGRLGLPGVRLLLARCLRESGDTRRALDHYAEALANGGPPAALLEWADACLAAGDARQAETILAKISQPDPEGRFHRLRAATLRALDRPHEAWVWSRRAAQARPADPDVHREAGRILEALGRARAALRQYDKSLRVHARNPEALYLRAKLLLRAGDVSGARRDLERCCYFDNELVEAWVLLRALEAGRSGPGAEQSGASPALQLELPSRLFKLTVGQRIEFEARVVCSRGQTECRLDVLESFGGGVRAVPRAVDLNALKAGESRTVGFWLEARRPSEANFRRPWTLTFVLSSAEGWTRRTVELQVSDPRPGRCFLVLTNDHEPRLHRGRMGAGGRYPVSPEETDLDLVLKGRAANDVARKHGFVWTHLIDVGAALGLPQWAANRNASWREVYSRVRDFYRDSREQGQDCQTHLHLVGLPASYFFCYHHDPVTDTVSFDLDAKNRSFPGWQVNSWANVVRRYGRTSDPNSRVGSLRHAALSLGGLFHGSETPWQPSFFRAGQWDLGRDTAEREKSVLALRENGFLADSSVTLGNNCYRRPFRFGNAPDKATYFTRMNNPEQAARTLLEAGLVETVPILLPHGEYAMTPGCDPAAVVSAYRSFLDGERVKPGRHLIVEIEHLGAMPDPRQAAGRGAEGGKWGDLERHLGTVGKCCPLLEKAGATESIYAWLDYYSPEPVVRLGARASRDGVEEYSLALLGEGLIGPEARLFRLEIPVPLPAAGRSLQVVSNERVLAEVANVSGPTVSVWAHLSDADSGALRLRLAQTPV